MLGVNCQIPQCGTLVDNEGSFFVRHRVCRKHFSADMIIVYETPHRFCQQCAKLQPLTDFDGARKSCRAGLAAHSQRRRSKGRGGDAAGLSKSSLSTTDDAAAVSYGSSPQLQLAWHQNQGHHQQQQQQEGMVPQSQSLLSRTCSDPGPAAPICPGSPPSTCHPGLSWAASSSRDQQLEGRSRRSPPRRRVKRSRTIAALIPAPSTDLQYHSGMGYVNSTTEDCMAWQLPDCCHTDDTLSFAAGGSAAWGADTAAQQQTALTAQQLAFSAALLEAEASPPAHTPAASAVGAREAPRSSATHANKHSTFQARAQSTAQMLQMSCNALNRLKGMLQDSHPQHMPGAVVSPAYVATSLISGGNSSAGDSSSSTHLMLQAYQQQLAQQPSLPPPPPQQQQQQMHQLGLQQQLWHPGHSTASTMTSQYPCSSITAGQEASLAGPPAVHRPAAQNPAAAAPGDDVWAQAAAPAAGGPAAAAQTLLQGPDWSHIDSSDGPPSMQQAAHQPAAVLWHPGMLAADVTGVAAAVGAGAGGPSAAAHAAGLPTAHLDLQQLSTTVPDELLPQQRSPPQLLLQQQQQQRMPVMMQTPAVPQQQQQQQDWVSAASSSQGYHSQAPAVSTQVLSAALLPYTTGHSTPAAVSATGSSAAFAAAAESSAGLHFQQQQQRAIGCHLAGTGLHHLDEMQQDLQIDDGLLALLLPMTADATGRPEPQSDPTAAATMPSPQSVTGALTAAEAAASPSGPGRLLAAVGPSQVAEALSEEDTQLLALLEDDSVHDSQMLEQLLQYDDDASTTAATAAAAVMRQSTAQGSLTTHSSYYSTEATPGALAQNPVAAPADTVVPMMAVSAAGGVSSVAAVATSVNRSGSTTSNSRSTAEQFDQLNRLALRVFGVTPDELPAGHVVQLLQLVKEGR